MCADPAAIALLPIWSELREFNLVNGDPRSHHTTPEGNQYRYVMLGFVGASLDEVRAAMCKALQMLREDCRIKLTLYLRSGPSIERDSESDNWCIRMRIAVPGANWTRVITKPEGLPYPKV